MTPDIEKFIESLSYWADMPSGLIAAHKEELCTKLSAWLAEQKLPVLRHHECSKHCVKAVNIEEFCKLTAQQQSVTANSEHIGIQACRPEDRAMLQTSEGGEMVRLVAQALQLQQSCEPSKIADEIFMTMPSASETGRKGIFDGAVVHGALKTLQYILTKKSEESPAPVSEPAMLQRFVNTWSGVIDQEKGDWIRYDDAAVQIAELTKTISLRDNFISQMKDTLRAIAKMEPFEGARMQQWAKDSLSGFTETLESTVPNLTNELTAAKEEAAQAQACNEAVAKWLSAALDDPKVCAEFKNDIGIFFSQDRAALNAAIEAAVWDEKRNPWKREIIEGLIVSHIYTSQHDKDPAKALSDLINWERAVALDPAVSAEARKLIETAVEPYRKDAERYRFLRNCHWSESSMCVVTHPKNSVRLGHVCPSEDHLDKEIDAAIATQSEGKKE